MAGHSEQAELLEDPVSIDIDQMLKSVSKKSSKPCISKVPNYHRGANEKAYEPQVISIGPYHRGKDHLVAMEEQKILFLQKLLEERRENDVSVYVKKMRKLEDQARQCYAELVSNLGSDGFVKLLLLDGVFIVQIIRRQLEEFPKYLEDMIDCYNNGLYNSLCQDLLLVENQLPFFVLRKLFCMIERSRADQDLIFMEAIFKMFVCIVPVKARPKDNLKSLKLSDIKHLLHFTFIYWFHPSNSKVEDRQNRNCSSSYIKHLLDFVCHCCFHPSTSEAEEREENPRGDDSTPFPGDRGENPRDDDSTPEMEDREENPRYRNCFRSYIKHLLDFACHCCFLPSTSEVEDLEENPRDDYSTPSLEDRGENPRDDDSTPEMEDLEENPRDRNCFRSHIKHLLDFACHCCFHPSTSELEDREENSDCFELNFIRCATELKEAGIKFKLPDGNTNTMFNIRFENGTLYIPEIKIGDDTEPFLRSLIAYEQLFLADRDLKLATDYMSFMDYLIDSPKDVEILCQHGIIKNMLGDDKTVATMVNGLGFGVIFSPNFYYTEVFDKINKYRSRPCNSWMANLKHNYVNSPWAPWALISVVAAALILLCTLLQTVFSVLSYFQ